MKLNYIFLITSILILGSCKTTKMNNTSKSTTLFHIGTQTSKNFSTSQGIYTSTVDNQGNLSDIKLAANTENPSYLTKTPDNKYIVSTNSGGDIGLTSFKINGDQLIKINTANTGKSPCFVSNNNEYTLNANYKDGSVDLHKINNNGELSSLLNTQTHKITTPSKHKRQKQAFAHSCYFEPNTNNIIAIDLGANKILFSTIDKTENKLIPNKFSELEMPLNSGPRLLTFHPTKPYFYVVNELSSTISLIEKNTLENSYQLIETVTTLPEDYTDNNIAAHIEITKDAKFLYMSNRGHDSIAVFSVLENGKLKFIERVSVHGKHPRNFSLSKDNRFLIVANRDTNNICSFKRNLETGKLTFIDEIKAPRATCILF